MATGKVLYKLKADWGQIAWFRGYSLIIGAKEYDLVHQSALREWAQQPRYVAVSPNGKRMITAGWYDSTPLLWDLEK